MYVVVRRPSNHVFSIDAFNFNFKFRIIISQSQEADYLRVCFLRGDVGDAAGWGIFKVFRVALSLKLLGMVVLGIELCFRLSHVHIGIYSILPMLLGRRYLLNPGNCSSCSHFWDVTMAPR